MTPQQFNKFDTMVEAETARWKTTVQLEADRRRYLDRRRLAARDKLAAMTGVFTEPAAREPLQWQLVVWPILACAAIVVLAVTGTIWLLVKGVLTP